MNVLPGQPVELRVTKRTSENFIPPLKKSGGRAFTGSGHRLGSPVPNFSSEASGSGAAMPGTFPGAVAVASSSTSTAGTGTERASISTAFEVDQSLPTTSVQIRLADGTR